jgi:membrane protein
VVAWFEEGKELVERYQRGNGPAWAAALSFNALLSLVPLLLCLVAGLSLLLQNPEAATRQAQEFLVAQLPGPRSGENAQAILAATHLQDQAAALISGRGWAALIGIVSLIWTGSRLFVSGMNAVNGAFGVDDTRGFVAIQLRAFGLLLLAGLLFVTSLAPAFFPVPGGTFVGLLGSLLTSALMFALIFRSLPSPDAGIRGGDALLAGVGTALLWELAKRLFALYFRVFGAGQDKLYGSLGGAAVFLTWIYLSSILLLFGALVAKRLSERRLATSDQRSPAPHRRPSEGR